MKMSDIKLNYYLSLTKMSYEDVVNKLIIKYGAVNDDYFRKASYERFLKNEIKHITKGKYAKGNEGLYTHHVAEIRALDLSNENVIKHFRPLFDYQKKENLVYADLVEHLILHALITKETNGEFGLPGYSAYLRPIMVEWYVDGKVPKPEWMKKCLQRASLSSSDVTQLLDEIDSIVIGPIIKKKSLDAKVRYRIQSAICEITTIRYRYELLRSEYRKTFSRDNSDTSHERQLELVFEGMVEHICGLDNGMKENDLLEYCKDKLRPFILSTEEIHKIESQYAAEKQLRENRELDQIKRVNREWENEHPFLDKLNYSRETPRRKILRLLYDMENQQEFNSFKEFISSKNSYLLDELMNELEKEFSNNN
ncbi:hypothetical protein [Latilactobacillus curvatus]|uniref:hypothetical protein n=1 Tax=Latilactobacillus curvatus TaxID=28038 RepID=UPI0019D46C15|nr:hypothetical protein [Latilactobacillus curvatus]